jgi:hypothetical protein
MLSRKTRKKESYKKKAWKWGSDTSEHLLGYETPWLPRVSIFKSFDRANCHNGGLIEERGRTGKSQPFQERAFSAEYEVCYGPESDPRPTA